MRRVDGSFAVPGRLKRTIAGGQSETSTVVCRTPPSVLTRRFRACLRPTERSSTAQRRRTDSICPRKRWAVSAVEMLRKTVPSEPLLGRSDRSRWDGDPSTITSWLDPGRLIVAEPTRIPCVVSGARSRREPSSSSMCLIICTLISLHYTKISYSI